MENLILQDIEDTLPSTIELRRSIHSEPEVGLDLPKTQQKILTELNDLGLTIRLGDNISSIVADLVGQGEGKTLLFRADMDALSIQENTNDEFASTIPGAMHACGHDAHSSILVSAAKVLSKHRHKFAGRIRFMFQPGEENHYGARQMIENGVLDNVDNAFALHISPNLPTGAIGIKSGPIMSAADRFTIHIKGQGGHASLSNQVKDPLLAACQLVVSIQGITERVLGSFQPAVVAITQIKSGNTTNTVSSSVKLEGTLRTLNRRAANSLFSEIKNITENVSSLFGCQASAEFKAGYPVTKNNKASTSLIAKVIEETTSQSQLITLPNPLLGADDFGFVLDKVPGAMFLLGVCPPNYDNPLQAPPCHSDILQIDENALAVGTHVFVATALEYFK